MTTTTPEAPATTKLSAAMRKGFRILKGKHLAQVTRDFYQPNKGACAVGMAYVAMAPDPEKLDEFFLYEGADNIHVPLNAGDIDEELGLTALIQPEQQPQECRSTTPRQLNNLIFDLNDNLEWSIPKIADWLESIGR